MLSLDVGIIVTFFKKFFGYNFLFLYNLAWITLVIKRESDLKLHYNFISLVLSCELQRPSLGDISRRYGWGGLAGSRGDGVAGKQTWKGQEPDL